MKKRDKAKNGSQAAIERIEEMEQAFDQVCAVQAELHKAITACSEAAEAFRKLSAYYAGEWKQDYAADEKGELPSGLKRGVLSEDGLWDMFSESKELIEQMKKLIEEIEGA